MDAEDGGFAVIFRHFSKFCFFTVFIVCKDDFDVFDRFIKYLKSGKPDSSMPLKYQGLPTKPPFTKGPRQGGNQ
ncbi:hypothetical protein TH25_18155 [Thalassospira profundimaris]|uniref:Uncharacterized protein n=1 Tax=Thalassospira profundimaris TaxID=502049 RepID=A0A367WXM9_9PROT|nr:hypothetical protein TH25_18155 [Thalassospira profundimaris]